MHPRLNIHILRLLGIIPTDFVLTVLLILHAIFVGRRTISHLLPLRNRSINLMVGSPWLAMDTFYYLLAVFAMKI